MSIRDLKHFLDTYGDEAMAVRAFMLANPTVAADDIASELAVLDMYRRYPLTMAFLAECERVSCR